jgi:hypothetical protein
MQTISYKRHRFPPEVIRQAVWLSFKFTLSLRDVEEILAERGIDVSYETVRCWAEKFGGAIAPNIRRARPRPGSVWHLDEMVVRINGRRMFIWRAGCSPTERRSRLWAAAHVIARVDCATITEPGIRISQCEDESARCSASSPPTAPSTISLTSNVT